MHDASHEERCLLGQAESGCPGCREFLASVQAASDAAQRAAVPPPAWLDAQVLGRTVLARLVRPRWSRIGLSLAAAAAALALIFVPMGKRSDNLHWTNGIERDITRLDSELAAISKEVALQSDTVEFDQDLDRIEAMATSLKKQKL